MNTQWTGKYCEKCDKLGASKCHCRPTADFVYGGDDPGAQGLYVGNLLVATIGQLERSGYDLDRMIGMSDNQMASLAAKLERDTARPAWSSNRSIEDMLGY